MRLNLKILSVLIAVLLLAAVSSKSQTEFDVGIRDSLVVDSVVTFSANKGVLPVYFFNDADLSALEITLGHESPDLFIDSFSFVDSRVVAFTMKGADQLISNNTITIYVIPLDEGYITPGEGLLGQLYFSFVQDITTQTVVIDTQSVIIGERVFSTSFADPNAKAYSPVFSQGFLGINPNGCCLGDRGNADNSPDDIIDIDDVVHLVSYMFDLENPAELACWDEANVDGSSDNIIDIDDLIWLIEFAFGDGPPPAPCP